MAVRIQLGRLNEFCQRWALIPFFIGAFSTILFDDGSHWMEIIWKAIRYTSYLMLLFPVVYKLSCFVFGAYQNGSLRTSVIEKLREMPVWIIALIISGLMIVTAKNPQAFILVLALAYISTGHYSNSGIAQLFFLTGSVFFILTVFLACTGVLENLTSIRQGDGTIRYALGFMFPLETQCFLLFITLAYLFAYSHKYNSYILVFLAGLNFLIFLATDARTSFLISELSILCAWALRHFRIRWSFPSWLLVLAVVLVFFVPVFGTYFYDSSNSVWISLNNLLTGRLELGHRALMKYPIQLLGEPIKWIGYGNATNAEVVSKTYNYVDCSYIKILLESGVLFWSLLLYGYSWLLCHFNRKKNTLYIFLICMILVFCVMEPRLDQLSMNFTLLFLSPAFYINRIRKEKA